MVQPGGKVDIASAEPEGLMLDARDGLELQNAFYETIREGLEADVFGKWAVVSNQRLVGVYESNREVSKVALKLVVDGACLVKRIGYVVKVEQPAIRVSHAPVRNPWQ